MNLAKVSSMRQITIPMDICKLLKINPGNKVLFFENEKGEVVMKNASIAAIEEAQTQFRGATKSAGIRNDDDIMDMVREVRYSTEEKESCRA